ncbi:MAG: peptidoglycan-associated lipoprotein Pal [Bdellovibrionales bacterium]|nr:peptidoglycan-associated lipoprotein Pal [Bdellovibrionales bacterium]
MFRNLVVFMFVGSLIVGCTTNKKKEDGEDVGAGISSKELNFDPNGSDSGSIAGLSTIHFEYDESSLTSEARSILSANAAWIKANTRVSIQIEGHCDSHGSIEYNLALGERRAKAVKSYLVSLGVAADRMTIISFGEEKPIAEGDNEAAHAKNRRANFVPIPN